MTVCAFAAVGGNIAAELVALRRVTPEQLHKALPAAAAAAAAVWAGYLLLSLMIQARYYAADGDEKDWKIQPSRGGGQAARRTDARAGPWVPLLSRRRPPLQRVFMTVNTVTAGLSAGVATVALCAGVTGTSQPRLVGVEEGWLVWGASMGWNFAIATCYQGAVEYYWHRCMHTKLLYSCCHKYHHAHKSPGPFDDMCIHPLEVRHLTLLSSTIASLRWCFPAGYHCYHCSAGWVCSSLNGLLFALPCI